MASMIPERLVHTLAAIDAENAQDPKSTIWNGAAVPRELLFAQRVTHWVEQLEASASELLQIAARAHTMRRWDIPRSNYSKDNLGYHEWRDACAAHHAKVAAEILRSQGYEDSFVDGLSDLILKKNWPVDPSSRVLEDADCLAFLELKLADYVDDWEQEKAVRILRKTLAKMTPKARELAATISLNTQCQDLLALVRKKPC